MTISVLPAEIRSGPFQTGAPVVAGPVHHPLMARRLPWAYGET